MSLDVYHIKQIWQRTELQRMWYPKFGNRYKEVIDQPSLSTEDLIKEPSEAFIIVLTCVQLGIS
jgi:hypothetical protein